MAETGNYNSKRRLVPRDPQSINNAMPWFRGANAVTAWLLLSSLELRRKLGSTGGADAGMCQTRVFGGDVGVVALAWLMSTLWDLRLRLTSRERACVIEIRDGDQNECTYSHTV